MRNSDETILLVEDDHEFRGLLRNALERNGFNVIDAANGKDALIRFEQAPDTIGLVITDLLMPQMSGLELLIALRRKTNVPVIFITGNDDALKVEKFVDIKNARYLLKPFRQSDLMAVIKKVLTGNFSEPEPQLTKST